MLSRSLEMSKSIGLSFRRHMLSKRTNMNIYKENIGLVAQKWIRQKKKLLLWKVVDMEACICGEQGKRIVNHGNLQYIGFTKFLLKQNIVAQPQNKCTFLDFTRFIYLPSLLCLHYSLFNPLNMLLYQIGYAFLSVFYCLTLKHFLTPKALKWSGAQLISNFLWHRVEL